MNDVAVMFLAFIATYFVFMYFAYRLAKIFFPKVDYKVEYSEEEIAKRNTLAKKRMANRMAIKKA